MKSFSQTRYNELLKLYGKDLADKRRDEYQILYNNYIASMSKSQQKKKILKKRQIQRSLNKIKHKHKKSRKQLWLNKINDFAASLEKNLPKSEQWFRKLYSKHYQCKSDEFNSTFCSRYIPDVINHNFKYIIEIDGSIHDTISQKVKDYNKDLFYKSQGYSVFRLEAFNIKQYIDLINWLNNIRIIAPKKEFQNFTLQFNSNVL